MNSHGEKMRITHVAGSRDFRQGSITNGVIFALRNFLFRLVALNAHTVEFRFVSGINNSISWPRHNCVKSLDHFRRLVKSTSLIFLLVLISRRGR